jgi:CubicO group peptidase (beta-lactamase class C family)
MPLSEPARPVPYFDEQDKIFSSAFAILHEAIAQRAFPAASVAVTQAGKLVALKAIGKFVYQDESALSKPSLDRDFEGFPAERASLLSGRSGNFPVDITTLFDLASLTKPVATATMAMLLYERGLLELDAPISGTVPEFLAEADARRHEVTFRMLLAHSSGLPAYERLFLKAETRQALLRAAFSTALIAAPATQAEYSDIGFIILGAALERIAQEPLDVFCQREIFGPLAMPRTTFNPPAAQRNLIPPTADEREPPTWSTAPKPRSTFRNRIIQGEVQDENASILGDVAGHAGLFSTAEDLAVFSHALLQGGSPILRPETIALFSRRDTNPPGTTRALGWDTPSSPSQSGKYFGPAAFGHLGYTGTSLWIDHDRQLSITLLTNRTWPDCANQAIKQVRPKFHDAVIEALS